MNFRTIVDIPKPNFEIQPSEALLFVGSCFANEIGRRFRENGFSVVINPYGTMYNPASILHTVERFLADNPSEVPQTVFLTLGTNRVYRLKETGEIVDNCEKRPHSLFQEEQLSVDACAACLETTVDVLRQRNPDVRVVLTVSPIRYRKYGYHESQLSKAVLLLAADRLTTSRTPAPPHPRTFAPSHPRTPAPPHLIYYFPAYEILTDELRDYRFYAPDMLHPSQQAVDYVWERLVDSCFSTAAKSFLDQWRPLKQTLAHRPFNPDSEEYKSLLQKTVQQAADLRRRFGMPHLLALILLLSTFLLLLFPAPMQAAIPDMKFRRLDARDGLSTTQVNCIFRDTRGLVWIGTPFGLNRYDGYRIKTYYSHVSDSTTMPTSYVDDVMEAADGRLWLRHGMTYSSFDPQTEAFDRHPERWLRSMGVKGGIERIYIDRHKHFWVKTYDQGFWWLDPANRHVCHFDFGSGPQQFDADFGISSMTEYGNSLIVMSNNGDMLCFNTRKIWISWKSHTLRRMGTAQNTGYSLTVDAQHNLWVLVEGRGYVWLRSAQRWVTSAAEALRLLGVSGLPAETKIWAITIDRRQQLWLATDHQGLYVVNLQQKTLRQFLNVKNDETTISGNTLRTIYRDQYDRMWISTYMNGVNYYAENLFPFRHITAGNINTVCVDADGRYWFGSDDRGIIRYDAATGTQTVFGKSDSGLASDVIVSSLAATDGVLWFGTYEGGLAQYKDGRFRVFKENDKPRRLVHNSVWALCEDPWGNIWLGTLGAGLQRIDRKTGAFTTLDTTSGLASNYISSIQLTPGGWLLVAHTQYYSLVNPRTMEVRNCRIEDRHDGIPLMPASTQVVEDTRGLVWQCTPSGVTIADTAQGRNYLLDAQCGLYGAANGIVEDPHHAVWVITQDGISCVIPQQHADSWTFVVRNFNRRDGLQVAPYNQRSAVLTPDGKLLVGGHEGVDVIDTRHLGRVQHPEQPVISGVCVLDGPSHPVTGSLRLAYDENHLTLQLATNSGEVHNRSRFAYRLSGFNSQWIYTDETRPDVVYTGLPSGSYTFCVRMLNDDGTLGNDEYRLDITVASPWYRSWWMLVIYLLAAATVLYVLYRRYCEKLRLERLKLQQENSHRLDEQRQRFYDTVSDELRQPFIDTFESLNAMMQRESDEQRYEQQQRVFSHVEDLLEQVNAAVERHHGKDKLKPQIREFEITSLDEKLVRDATDYVERNLHCSDISVETMAEALGMSRVHLYKRLTALTDLTPSEFIRQIRLRHAEQLLRKSQMTVAEVAYKVGFNNPRYFSKYFKELYGMMPSEYKNSHS